MKADRFIVVASVLLAGVYFYAVEQIPVRDIGDPLGPKAIPRILGVLLLLAAGLLWLEIRLASKAPSPGNAEPLPDKRRPDERVHAGVVLPSRC